MMCGPSSCSSSSPTACARGPRLVSTMALIAPKLVAVLAAGAGGGGGGGGGGAGGGGGGGGGGGAGGGGGGGRYQLRFERVPLAAVLDEATWQGLHKRYWRFPCYLAPSVTRVAADAHEEEQGLGPLFEGHPTE